MIFLEETDHRFYIDHSTLPNAGKGLFAKEKIQKGDRINILGVSLKRRDISDFCTEYANRHKYSYKDLVIIPVGYAAMINFHPEKNSENVFVIHTEQEIYLEVIKDVNIDEELFLFGGNEIDTYFKNQINNDIEKNSSEQNEFFLKDFYNLSFLKD